jgi:hypothetical protein
MSITPSTSQLILEIKTWEMAMVTTKVFFAFQNVLEIYFLLRCRPRINGML